MEAVVACGSSRPFDSLLIRSILDAKWRAFGLRRYMYQFVWYIVGLAALVMLSFLVVDHMPCYQTVPVNPTTQPVFGYGNCTIDSHILSWRVETWSSREWLITVSYYVSLIWTIYSLVHESIQCYTSPWRHLSDFWNILDMFQIVLSIAILVTYQLGLEDVEVLLAVAVFFRWYGLLFYLQAFRSTGPLIRMILAILQDIRWFLLVLVVGVLATGNAFYVLLRHEKEPGFSDTKELSLSMFKMLILGDFDTDHIVKGPFKHVNAVLFALSMVLVPLILLNLLIAMMSTSYERIKEETEKELNLLRAKLILEMEVSNLASMCAKEQKQSKEQENEPKERKSKVQEYIHVMISQEQRKKLMTKDVSDKEKAEKKQEQEEEEEELGQRKEIELERVEDDDDAGALVAELKAIREESKRESAEMRNLLESVLRRLEGSKTTRNLENEDC